MNTTKRHSLLSAFFVSVPKLFLILLTLLLTILFSLLSHSVASAASKNLCSYSSINQLDETVTIAFVYDGDSVRLVDGRKLRLIGINTPEFATKNTATQPFADEARQFFQKLINKSKTVNIRYGIQKTDHYGRLLVHIFLKDTRNISALMLQNGLARMLHMPPNDWQFRCYKQLEQDAQKLKVGLWSDNFYKTKDVQLLKPTTNYHSNFQTVSGVVSQVKSTKKTIKILLGSHFVLRINKSNLNKFTHLNLNSILGKTITAQGYTVYYPKTKQFRMLVRHPIAMTIN